MQECWSLSFYPFLATKIKNNSKDRNCFIVTQKNCNKKELQGKKRQKRQKQLIIRLLHFVGNCLQPNASSSPFAWDKRKQNQKKKKTLSERKESILSPQTDIIVNLFSLIWLLSFDPRIRNSWTHASNQSVISLFSFELDQFKGCTYMLTLCVAFVRSHIQHWKYCYNMQQQKMFWLKLTQPIGGMSAI